MLLADDIRTLAEEIGSRVAAEREFTLVLGSGIAKAAGLPEYDAIVAEAGGATSEGADRRIIERLLWSYAVPTFMYEAANLVRDGSFPRVITTGYDNLLERALADAGLRRGNHFTITDFGPSDDSAPPAATTARIRIARTHGASHLKPQPMDKALGVKYRGPGQVLVVVGHQWDAPALERWLGELEGCELWWVSPDGDDAAASRLAWRGEAHSISGEATKPDSFFSQLGLLLHLPGDEALLANEPATSSGDDPLDKYVVQTRIDQANVVRRSIEQRVTSSGADPAASKQLRAQEDEISRLGQAWQPATSGGDEPPPNPAVALLARYEDLRARLEPLASDASAPVDADTLSYVDGQVEALRREADKPEANPVVIAGAEAMLDSLLASVASFTSSQAS